MACNDGLHGALFRSFRGEWSCLLCGESVEYHSLMKLREEANKKEEVKKLPAPILKTKDEKDDNSQHKVGVCN